MSYDIKVFCERAFKDLPDSIQNVFSEAHPVYYIMTVYSLSGSPVIINRKYINTPDSLKSGEKFIKNDYFEYNLVKKEINLSRLKKNDAPLMKMNEGDTLYLVRDELVKEDSVVYDVSLLKSENISFIMDLDGIMKISCQGEI